MFGLTNFGKLGVIGGKRTSLSAAIAALFSSGEQGVWYDPSDFSTLFQDSAGTTPVTAVEQPVGLMLDKSKGLVLGPELVTNGDGGTFATGIAGVVSMSAATISRDATLLPSGSLKVVANGSASCGALLQTFSCTVGAVYRIRGSFFAPSTNTSSNATAVSCLSYGGSAIDISAQVSAEDVWQTFDFLFTASAVTHDLFGWSLDRGVAWGAPGDTCYFDNISIKEIPGNHATQATAGSRPTLKDISGYKSAFFDGSNDSLSTTTGGGGTTGFFFCQAIKPTGGVGTVRIIFGDGGANTGYHVALSATNKLVMYGGTGGGFTELLSTDDVNVGETHLVTTWDDGVNFNVQVDAGAVVSMARPAVVAGLASLSIGKDGNGGGLLFTGNLYPQVYVKNSGLTAGQRASVQAYCKSKAGL